MAELAVRVGLVGAVAFVAIMISRKTRTVIRTYPTGVLAGPAIVFFSSRTCSSCENVRQTLDHVAGPTGYREVGWEDDPDGWGAFGVETVPTVVLVDGSGAVIADRQGQVDARTLRRWSKRLRRDGPR